jgi:hypothetical protein
MHRIDREQYLSHFASSPIQNSALKEAQENRKFEIELYWKRAAYFWVFIGATFGGYSALQDSPLFGNRLDIRASLHESASVA